VSDYPDHEPRGVKPEVKPYIGATGKSAHIGATVPDGWMNPAVTGMVLSPADPFEKACIDIVAMNRRKRADYSEDGDIFSSFGYTSSVVGFDNRWQSAIFNCAQKLARIGALTKNGRLKQTRNEAVEDTLLDNAVYGVIAYAIYLQDNNIDVEVPDAEA
jgi:hypothetical protein